MQTHTHYIQVHETDAWVHGYWSYDWADSFLQVTHIVQNKSTAEPQISVAGPVLYGLSKGAKFYGINLLSELDSPGEYYLDRSPTSKTYGRLFFWPPSDLSTAEAFVSLGDYTLVLGGSARGVGRAADVFARAAAEYAAAYAATAATAPQNTATESLDVPCSFSRKELLEAEVLDRAAAHHLHARGSGGQHREGVRGGEKEEDEEEDTRTRQWRAGETGIFTGRDG